jgi:phosphatidylinositol glycan class O
MSKVQTISVIAFLSFCMIVGSLVFSRGFLLNRQIVHETAGPCLHTSRAIHIKGTEKVVTTIAEADNGLSSMSNWCHPNPPFPKLILILVDALRFDFVQRMKFLSSVVEKGSSQATAGVTSCNFKFVADPPTTTMQRLKALMTGTMPTFIDASANFNRYITRLLIIHYKLMLYLYFL